MAIPFKSDVIVEGALTVNKNINASNNITTTGELRGSNLLTDTVYIADQNMQLTTVNEVGNQTSITNIKWQLNTNNVDSFGSAASSTASDEWITLSIKGLNKDLILETDNIDASYLQADTINSQKLIVNSYTVEGFSNNIVEAANAKNTNWLPNISGILNYAGIQTKLIYHSGYDSVESKLGALGKLLLSRELQLEEFGRTVYILGFTVWTTTEQSDAQLVYTYWASDTSHLHHFSSLEKERTGLDYYAILNDSWSADDWTPERIQLHAQWTDNDKTYCIPVVREILYKMSTIDDNFSQKNYKFSKIQTLAQYLKDRIDSDKHAKLDANMQFSIYYIYERY